MASSTSASPRREIRLSGSGGQGILLAAAIIAEAAAALDRCVVQSQSYGPAARGGASKAEVIIADDEIDYPEVMAPDLSLCLSQAAYDKYAAETRSDGLVVYDSGLIEPRREDVSFRRIGLPFTQASADRLGKKVVANIVAVGALVAIGDFLPADEVEAAVVRRVPERFRELNTDAFRLGLRLVDEAEASNHAAQASRATVGSVVAR